MKAVVSRGSTWAARALRRHSSCAIWRARSRSDGSADCRNRRNVIGVPSDSKLSSYFLPFWSVAAQVMLDTCRVMKLPIELEKLTVAK